MLENNKTITSENTEKSYLRQKHIKWPAECQKAITRIAQKRVGRELCLGSDVKKEKLGMFSDMKLSHSGWSIARKRVEPAEVRK